MKFSLRDLFRWICAIGLILTVFRLQYPHYVLLIMVGYAGGKHMGTALTEKRWAGAGMGVLAAAFALYFCSEKTGWYAFIYLLHVGLLVLGIRLFSRPKQSKRL